MSPSVCSHVVLGKRHGPRLPPSAYRIPDHAPHSSLKCWKVLDHGPHGFPRIRDRDQNAFPHVLARPNIFSPEYWRDSEARRFAFPSSWIQEAPLKGLEGGDFGIYIRKTLLRQMDAKRPRHGEGIPWGRGGGWGPGSKNGCAPAAPPSPHGILLCTLILSISNGRHGVFSPPPLWNRISPCFCGIPFPHRRGFVLCFLRHPLPHAPLRFCGFPTVRAGQSGRRTRPPFCGTGWFSLLPYTHTHTSRLRECMAILSPNPPPVEHDGFPFCPETHRHTHTTCLCMYGVLSPHMLSC